MLTLVFLLMILMAITGWYFAKDFFAPYVIAPCIWIIIIILYKLLPSDIYPIANQFPGALAVWSMGFFLGVMYSVMHDDREFPCSKQQGHQEIDLLLGKYHLVAVCIGLLLLSRCMALSHKVQKNP